MSTTDSISATQRALRSQLRRTHAELVWQKEILENSLDAYRGASTARARIEQCRRDQDDLLAALAENGWLTAEDTSGVSEEKVAF